MATDAVTVPDFTHSPQSTGLPVVGLATFVSDCAVPLRVDLSVPVHGSLDKSRRAACRQQWPTNKWRKKTHGSVYKLTARSGGLQAEVGQTCRR